MNEQTCRKCGRCFPATQEFFRRKESTRSGLESRCRTCARASDKAYYASNYERILEQAHKREGQVAEYQRQYRAKNREKRAQDHKAWYEANRERVSEYNAMYYQEKTKKKRASKTKASARGISMDRGVIGADNIGV
ncbi:MAG: hypothetical protein KKB13_21215 [Chloroflexi bacterium]|nr:hypothetical protein [Chloroflexota bacterium]